MVSWNQSNSDGIWKRASLSFIVGRVLLDFPFFWMSKEKQWDQEERKCWKAMQFWSWKKSKDIAEAQIELQISWFKRNKRAITHENQILCTFWKWERDVSWEALWRSKQAKIANKRKSVLTKEIKEAFVEVLGEDHGLLNFKFVNRFHIFSKSTKEAG